MSLSAQIQHQFFVAAQDDPSLQKRPSVKIELETFRQIFSPVKTFLDKDPVYGQYEMNVSRQVEELRKMCLEAYAAHTTTDAQERKDRAELLNVLQSIMENIREAENA